MSHCRVVSHWHYSESGESYGAAIEEDYAGLGLSDLVNPANVPPIPNIFVGESKAGGGLVSQIINDPNYTEASVITSHDTEADVPSQQRFDSIKALLQTKGMTSAQVDSAIGTAIGTRTNWDVSQDLITWLKAQ